MTLPYLYSALSERLVHVIHEAAAQGGIRLALSFPRLRLCAGALPTRGPKAMSDGCLLSMMPHDWHSINCGRPRRSHSPASLLASPLALPGLIALPFAFFFT